MPDPALADAYRAARYRIDAGGQWIERRIGVVDAAADAALAAFGCRAYWSILTPCNPGSVPLSADVNAKRLAQLRATVIHAGWRHLPSENVADDGTWHESGLCLLDVDMTQVRELAAHFGQLAFVHGVLGAETALIRVAQPSP